MHANTANSCLCLPQVYFTFSFTPSYTMQPSKPRPKPPRWSTPCHLIVFIRNLKLLHLDQRKDWPDITLHTLSDSPGNQRKRLKAVEWGLYHLFAILDPETARNVCAPAWYRSVHTDAARNSALSSRR